MQGRARFWRAGSGRALWLAWLVTAGVAAAAFRAEGAGRWAEAHWPQFQCPDSGKSIVLFKSHKTGSTTLSNLFSRLGRRRGLVPFAPEGCRRYMDDCPESFESAGREHDIAVNHFQSVGSSDGLAAPMAWEDKRARYAKVLRTGNDFQTYTIVREPVSTFVSKYW